MAARIGLLVGRAEVGAAAGLGQRPAGIVEPRPDDLALGQQPGGGVVGAAGLADGGVAVHQAVAQVVRRGDGDVGRRIGDVLGRERQAGDVGVGVYEARHQRAPADIDHCRPAGRDRLGRHRRDAAVAHQHVEAALQFSEPVKDEMGIDEKRLRHAGSVSYCDAMNDTSSALVLFLRRPGFHHLPGLGAVPLRACRDDRLRLWPAACRRDGRARARPPAHRQPRFRLEPQARPRPRGVARRAGLGQQKRAHRRPAHGHAARWAARHLRARAKPRLPDLRRHRGPPARAEARRRRRLRDGFLGLPRLPRRHGQGAAGRHQSRHGGAGWCWKRR